LQLSLFEPFLDDRGTSGGPTTLSLVEFGGQFLINALTKSLLNKPARIAAGGTSKTFGLDLGFTSGWVGCLFAFDLQCLKLRVSVCCNASRKRRSLTRAMSASNKATEKKAKTQ
jgi:hypothetical protein